MEIREMKKFLETGCDGDWESCYQLAEHYYERKDYAQAVSWYKKAAECPDCNPLICFELGYVYQHGQGVDSDLIEAVQWYQKAVENDVPQALYNLAYFYQNGLVVDRNPEKAVELLQRATSLMRRLQLERYSYEEWKAESDARCDCAEREAQECRVEADALLVRNQQLSLENSELDWKRKQAEESLNGVRQRVESLVDENSGLRDRAEQAEKAFLIEQERRKSTEQAASTERSKAEERLRAAEELITRLIREHNSSYEETQSAYEKQIGGLKKAYEEEMVPLLKSLADLRVHASALEQELNHRMQELGKKTKAVKLAMFLAAIFLLLFIVFLIL